MTTEITFRPPARLCSLSPKWAHSPSPRFRGEREGPIAKQWEGEVGADERSGVPHLTPPSPPPGAERENQWRGTPDAERARAMSSCHIGDSR
jgi:hypothetical protein